MDVVGWKARLGWQHHASFGMARDGTFPVQDGRIAARLRILDA
jgi:hypothetical protein